MAVYYLRPASRRRYYDLGPHVSGVSSFTSDIPEELPWTTAWVVGSGLSFKSDHSFRYDEGSLIHTHFHEHHGIARIPRSQQGLGRTGVIWFYFFRIRHSVLTDIRSW